MESNDNKNIDKFFFIDELFDMFLIGNEGNSVVDVQKSLLKYTKWKINALHAIQKSSGVIEEFLFPNIYWDNDVHTYVAKVSKKDGEKEKLDFQIFDWKGLFRENSPISKAVNGCNVDNGERATDHYVDPNFIIAVFSPIVMDFSLYLFHSVLSGEYAMQDSFSDTLIKILEGIQPFELLKEGDQDTWMTLFQDTVVSRIFASMLSDYINFNTYIEAQIDKKPSNILSSRDNTLFRRQDYERKINVFVSQNSDLEKFLRLIPFVFHELLEMTKVDQNFYYSKDRLYTLMYLDELINGFSDREYKSDRAFRNLVNAQSVNAVLGKERVEEIQSMLDMVSVKTRFLISKIMLCCHDSVRDLIYVGWGNKYVFDARKCYDKQQGKSERTKLLTDNYFKSIPVGGNEPKRIKSDLWKLFEYASNNCSGEDNDVLKNSAMDYERQYINRYKKNKGERNDGMEEIYYNDSWYKVALRSVSGVGGTDIRHYNTKVLEMARDAVNDTAVLKGWINNNRYNFDEQKGFEQIEKVLSFLQIRYDETVCYDSEMLVNYAHWCIDFLELVSKNTAMSNLNNEDRPARIEEGLLLLEILNGLLRRLIENIESGEYCVPFASKFRGCFCEVMSISNTLNMRRIFIDFEVKSVTDGLPIKPLSTFFEISEVYNNQGPTYKLNEFKFFVDPHGHKEDNPYTLDDRKKILFIASTFNGPVNYEELKNERDNLRTKTSKLRNEIHTEYFDRVRGSIKEDMNEKLDENKRSVIQILSIFAALLALTTTALSGVTAGKSGQFYLMVMLGFVLCLGVFILLLHFLVLNKDYWKSKEKYEKDLSLIKDDAESLKKEIEVFESEVLNGSNLIQSDKKKTSELTGELKNLDNLAQDIIKNMTKKKHYWDWHSPLTYLLGGLMVILIGVILLTFKTQNEYGGNDKANTQVNVYSENEHKPLTEIRFIEGDAKKKEK